jgi:hypothetical protein
MVGVNILTYICICISVIPREKKWREKSGGGHENDGGAPEND